MPLHDMQCRSCGRLETHTYIPEPYPCSCGGVLTRKFSFAIQKPWQPHFNHSVGKYVHNRQEFHDALKSASDHASAYTGTEHNFQPTDLRDEPSHSKEGIYETQQRRADDGWRTFDPSILKGA